MPALDFSASTNALIFDQSAKVTIPMTYKDSSGQVVPMSGYGVRMDLFVDTSGVLLSCTVGNGRVTVADTAPNLVVEWDATDTANDQPISGYTQGKWTIYLDPNGVEDGDSFKLTGGFYSMNPGPP